LTKLGEVSNETFTALVEVSSAPTALTEAGRAKLGESLPLWEEDQRRVEHALGAEKARALRATLNYIASPEFSLRVDGKS
jgi:hypothetical protein